MQGEMRIVKNKKKLPPPPLPNARHVREAASQWKEYAADGSGEKYYYNTSTNQSVWEIPAELKQIREAAAMRQEQASAEEDNYAVLQRKLPSRKLPPPALPSSQELEAIRLRVVEHRSHPAAVSHHNGQRPVPGCAKNDGHDAFESLHAHDGAGVLEEEEIRSFLPLRLDSGVLRPDGRNTRQTDADCDGQLRQRRCLCDRQTIHGKCNSWLVLLAALFAGLVLIVGAAHCCLTERGMSSPADGDDVQVTEGFGNEEDTARKGQCTVSRPQEPTCSAQETEDELTAPLALGEPVTIKAKIRDFDNAHIHFGCLNEPGSVGEGCGWNNAAPAVGMVEAELDADGKMVLAGETAENTEAFDLWFSDNAVEVQLVEVELLFELDTASGYYRYDSNRYLPLDSQPPGLFTTEIHLPFRYEGGEVFVFRGDDDVWVFINGKLGLDLGGCHPPVAGSIHLDAQAADLGIVIGRVYDLVIFQAERCFGGSNFKAELSPGLLSPPTDVLDSEFCLLPSCKDEEDDEDASGILTEPTCSSRQYTPPRCQSRRCTMACLPLLLALALCTMVVSLLPDAFMLKRGRRRLCLSCLHIASTKDRVLQRWMLNIVALGMLLLIVSAVARWYILAFSCCATMQPCPGGADAWESEPWILTASNSVAVESTATWQKGGSALRVEYCTGAAADWFTPDCDGRGTARAACSGDWTCWTACSADCGGGVQTSSLEDPLPSVQSNAGCVATEFRPCNTHECAVCGDELGLCLLDKDARPHTEDRDGFALICCCWAPLAAAFVAILPLLLSLLWLLCNRPRGADDGGPAAAEDPPTMWIIFLLDPNGTRHAIEVMSNEFSIATILEKSSAATGIAASDLVLKFGGRVLSEGKALTSYGVQHGSEILVEANGKAVETRQQKSIAARRQLVATKGAQRI